LEGPEYRSINRVDTVPQGDLLNNARNCEK
jgi:hypothetical protein